QRFGDGGEKVTEQRNRLSALQLVRQRPGKSLHDILQRLGETVDQADDAAGRMQGLREEHRQHRVEHLGRDVGEQAREGEQKGRPREAAEIALQEAVGHQSSHKLPNESVTPPSALTMTTTSGGGRQTVSRMKPTSASAKSPGVLTELVQSGV